MKNEQPEANKPKQGDGKKCPACQGDGYIVTIDGEPDCCGYTLRDGSCCNEPVLKQVQRQEQCEHCHATGIDPAPSETSELKEGEEQPKERNYLILYYALQKIAMWVLPETGRFWDDDGTRPVSYEAQYGSNGVRDYMKRLAADAIEAFNQPATINKEKREAGEEKSIQDFWDKLDAKDKTISEQAQEIERLKEDVRFLDKRLKQEKRGTRDR